MACQIPYLDDNYQGEQLKALRNKHNDIVKKTIASKLFYRRDGYLQLSMDMSSTVRKQQEDFISKIPELSTVKVNKYLDDNDKIIFGHPTIGKSYLKDKGNSNFISLDDDYIDEIEKNRNVIIAKYKTQFAIENKGEILTKYQVQDGGTKPWNIAYNQMMQNLFLKAVKDAKDNNKILFTSNTKLLDNNISLFNKVITIPEEDFAERIKKYRPNAKYDIKEWKTQIDNVISKFPSNKVITTTGFLSDILASKDVLFLKVDKTNSKQRLDNNNKDVNYQRSSSQGINSSKTTIRDLAARISDRIGIPFKIIDLKSEKYKGKIENGVAYVNLAYATLDTAIHEILGHPIIKAIKNKEIFSDYSMGDTFIHATTNQSVTVTGIDPYGTIEITDKEGFKENITKGDYSFALPHTKSLLYKNLLKELETGTGKEVLDRIKRDYNVKNTESENGYKLKYKEYVTGYKGGVFKTKEDALNYFNDQADKGNLKLVENNTDLNKSFDTETKKYTLEEQQEEAIVELLGLYTAGKIDVIENTGLIFLLKKLLKEINLFIKSLLKSKEIEIDNLPDNMTIGDLSDLLAYSNSKLILPGYSVKYTTPDNVSFKTYQEANNHITELFKSSKEIDLSKVELGVLTIPDTFSFNGGEEAESYGFYKKDGKWFQEILGEKEVVEISEEEAIGWWEDSIKYAPINVGTNEKMVSKNVRSFIIANKEYAQAKEIIEEWKKVNGIKYNPQEVYSRGHEFMSVMGAYSTFEINLMMQNILEHISDNKKAGGQFAVSATTKVKGTRLEVLEEDEGKIRIKIFPDSEDILWAAPSDINSGSISRYGFTAVSAFSKKTTELVGVSFGKYPTTSNLGEVVPNLASIIDNNNSSYNELGIVLKGGNFELEYDDDIPSTTKKIIDGVNAVLKQKYGVIVKPKINKSLKSDSLKLIIESFDAKIVESKQSPGKYIVEGINYFSKKYNTKELANDDIESYRNELKTRVGNDLNIYMPYDTNKSFFEKLTGIQATQTNENLKESIGSITKANLKSNTRLSPTAVGIKEVPLEFKSMTIGGKDAFIKFENGKWLATAEGTSKIQELTELQVLKAYNKKIGNTYEKQYEEQALINKKVTALKEGFKKYPRVLIRSEVTKDKDVSSNFSNYEGEEDDPLDFPWQKIPSVTPLPSLRTTLGNPNKDATLKDRIFDGKDKIGVRGALTNIINNSTNENNKILARELIKIEFKDIDILLVDNDSQWKEKGARGLYYPAFITGELFGEVARIEILGNAAFRKNNGESTILHEILHHLSYVKLRNNSKKSNDFIKLFEYVESLNLIDPESITKNNPNGKRFYGVSNYDEFMSELFTNGQFIKVLANLPASGITNYKNLFVEIVAKLLEFFGIKGNRSLYEETVAIASNILKEEVPKATNYNYSTEQVSKDLNINRFFNNNKTTVEEALSKITQPELRVLAENLLKVLTPKQRSTSIDLVDDVDFRGLISEATGNIQINKNANFPKGDASKTIIHEIIHLVSIQYLKDNKSSILYKDFNKLFLHVKAQLEKEDKPYYGISTIEEFIAEALSNSEFIKELASMNALDGISEYDNLFEEFVSKILGIIKKMFGVADINLYNQVSALASQIISMNTDLVPNSLDSFEETVLYDMDNSSNQENSEFSEFLAADTKNQDMFLKIVGDIKAKLDNYIELISDGNIDYPSTQREIKLGELKNIKKLLTDENLVDAVTGLSNVITHSVNWIDIINDEFFGKDNLLMKYKAIQEQDTTTLSPEELTARDEEIAAVSKSLNKSKHFLYLFDSLEEFHNELQRGGFIAADKFNTMLKDKAVFEKEMTALGLNKDEIDSNYALLNEGNISLIDLKDTITKSHLDEDTTTLKESNDFKLKLDEVFKRNVNKTFSSQMSYSLSKAEDIKKQLKDLHYKVTAEWLYPDYEKIQNDLKLKDGDELYLSKEHFTALLKIAESEENIISNWLEATIQNKDPFVASLANKVSKAINNAHFTTISDAQEVTAARTASGFDDMTQQEREDQYAEMNNMITVLVEDSYGRAVEIEMNSIEEGIVIDTLHGKRKYKTTKVTAWKTGKHTSLAAAQKKLINTLLYVNKGEEKSMMNDLIEKSIDVDGNLTPKLLNTYLLENKDFELTYFIRQALFTKNLEGEPLNPGTFIKEISDLRTTKEREAFIKQKIKSVAFKQLYFNVVEKAKTKEEMFDMLVANNSNFNYNKLTKDDIEYILDNTTGSNDVEGFKFKLTKDYINKDSLLSIKDSAGNTLYAYMTSKGLKFGSKSDIINSSDVTSMYYKKMDFVELTDDYKLPLYSGKHQAFFKVLYNKHVAKNKTLGYKRLKHGIIAQVPETGINLKDAPQAAKDLITRIYEWFRDSYKHIKEAWIDIDQDPNVDKEEKKSFEQQYLNGEKVRNISMNYTKVLEDQSKLEKDLTTSLLAYTSMINNYQGLKQYDSQIQLARTVIAGDTLLGIDRRQAKKRDRKGAVIGKLKGGVDSAFAKQTADNLNKKALEFIDEMVYGDAEYAAFDLGLFNSNQLEGAASKFTAYSSLALNFIGAAGNLFNGKVATYLESVQGQYFDQETWAKAELEYIKNMATHFKDYKESDLNKKSKIGQLAMMLDAIQGEYLDSFDTQLRMKRFSDIGNTALFFTQSAPEHSIQLTNMIAMMMANKDANGESLWDKIPYVEGEGIKLTAELQNELLKFQGTLHSVNRRLNGAYSKIDKSRLQRRWFGRLALTFRKYIYQSFKARFSGESIDIASGQIDRGYVMSYYKELIEDIESNRTFAYKALKVFKQVGVDTGRFALGTANKLTFGALGKFANLDKIMGIDKLEYRRMKEAQRYIAEVSLYSALTFAGMILAAITSDDDDDDDKALKLLELIVKRQKADMGAFLPTMVNIPTGNIVPGFSSWDFTRRLLNSPIPAMRVYDNSVSLLNQLVGFDYTEDGIDFTYNDVYKKGGAGYEKGDLKITRLAQKSIIAPYWQIMKLAQADQQLKYLDLMNKNSK